MSFVEYTSTFKVLSCFTKEFVNISILKESRFFDGLNVDIQLGFEVYNGFEDLKNRAMEYERILAKLDNKRKGWSSSNNKKAKSFKRKSF